jgi:aminoglycoside 6'-N-acetyltransferase I
MNVATILSTANDAYIVKNLYPLYLHDLSEFSGEKPNQHGILEPNAVATLAEQGEVQTIWWQKPDVLFPFIIQADDRIAGFAFVARPPYVPEKIDHVLQEFFLLRSFRRTGIGRRAAFEIFNRFPGRWQLEVLAKNFPAQAFWRKILRQCSENPFEERSETTDAGRRRIFRFEISAASLTSA